MSGKPKKSTEIAVIPEKPPAVIHLFPEQILQIRCELFLTQKQMAHLVGVSERAYRNWEYGLTKPTHKHNHEAIFRLFHVAGDIHSLALTEMSVRFFKAIGKEDEFKKVVQNAIDKWLSDNLGAGKTDG